MSTQEKRLAEAKKTTLAGLIGLIENDPNTSEQQKAKVEHGNPRHCACARSSPWNATRQPCGPRKAHLQGSWN